MTEKNKIPYFHFIETESFIHHPKGCALYLKLLLQNKDLIKPPEDLKNT